MARVRRSGESRRNPLTPEARIEAMQREVDALNHQLAALKADLPTPEHEVMREAERRSAGDLVNDLIGAFSFERSPQGTLFWGPICQHLRAIESGHDCTQLPMPVAKWVKS